MQPPIRKQTDDLQEQYSQMTAIDCSDLPDLTRQEFRDETDVNKILARYGVNAPMRQPEYSEVDYSMDLQQSLQAIKEAEDAVSKLPPSLRVKYFTWERLLDGAYNGEFKTDLATYYREKEVADAAAAAAAVAASNPPV